MASERQCTTNTTTSWSSVRRGMRSSSSSSSGGHREIANKKNNNFAFKNIGGNGCRVGKMGSNLGGERSASRMCVNHDHVYRADLVHETWVKRRLFHDTAVPTNSCCCCCCRRRRRRRRRWRRRNYGCELPTPSQPRHTLPLTHTAPGGFLYIQGDYKRLLYAPHQLYYIVIPIKYVD